MSSLLNKLKGHGDKRQDEGRYDDSSAIPSESYNHPGSNAGYDAGAQSGYGNTQNIQNPTGDYERAPLTQHSDGGKYYAPKGTHVGSGHNTDTVGPHSSNLLNKMDPRVDSDQSKLGHNTQHGYNDPNYDQSYVRNQQQYGNTTQGPHSDLGNRLDPRVDSDNSRGTHGYGTTTTTTTNTSTSVNHGQYGTTHGINDDSNKRLPADPAHPTLLEKANPKVDTDTSRRHEGYGNTTDSGQYGSTHDSTKRLPEDPNHPSLKEKLDPRYDTDASRRQGAYGNTGYDNTGSTTVGPHSSNLANKADPRVDSDMSRQHGHNDQFATGATGAYASTESSRHHAQPVHNDPNTMMNRGHPHTSTHHGNERFDSNRNDLGPDGRPLPGPAPTTAGPHKSDMFNKLDPRVDSDQSKLEKEREREREGYGSGVTGATGARYGNEHERRINEGQGDRRLEDTGAAIGHTDRRHETTGIGHGDRHHDTGLGTHHDQVDRRDQYSSNSPNTARDSGYSGTGSTVPNTARDSGYSGTGSTVPNVAHRKPVTDSGTFNNPAATAQSTYGNTLDDEHDFECAKCGHKNTHLRKKQQQHDQYGNEKPSLMDRLNPKKDATGDGQAGFMK